MKKTLAAALTASLALALSSCVSVEEDPDVVESGTRSSGGAAGGKVEEPAEQGQLVDSGFGQVGQYANGIALVENTSDHAGQTVTVSMNFLDKAGEVITSASQVTSFNYPGQTISVAVSGDVGSPGVKVASVEPTLLIEDDGIFLESEVDYGTAKAEVVKEQYSPSYTAKVTVANPTSEPLQGPNVGIACFADGRIVGGGNEYPDLVPPNGQIVLTGSTLIVSGKPDSCTAYIQGSIYLD